MDHNLCVSIIVLTYRDFSGLEKTMAALLGQTYPNLQIIVSDDGSENYREEDFIRYVEDARKTEKEIILNHNDCNLGTVKNINRALELAKGDIIGFLGCGDCYISKNTIERAVSFFESSDVEVVTGKMKGVSVSNANKITVMPDKDICKLLREGDSQKVLNRMFNDNCFCAPTTFYRKSVYEMYGTYDERMRLIEDYPFLFKLMLNEVSFLFWDECITQYTFDGVSSGKKSPVMCADLEKIKELILLPNIDRCTGRNRRLFLYNYDRKRNKKVMTKISAALKYPDQFLYWQYKRVTDILKLQRRK